MSSVVRIQKRRSFSAIPDDILEDTRMRTETRLVLGWLIGRPDGWEIRVGFIQYKLGLSRGRWATTRKEMEKFGYLQTKRWQKIDGTFQWEFTVTDEPDTSETNIAGFSGDGQTSDGKPCNITTQSKQHNFNTPYSPPIEISETCYVEAKQKYSGYDIDALIGQWKEWLRQKKIKPEIPDKAFLAWVVTYTKNHPLPFGGGF